MNPSPSPPQEAEHIRHQQLTPESPRPQNVPSPANIPILELQMDPNFHESAHNNNGTSTPASQFASLSQTPNPLPPMPHFADPSTAASYQNVGAQGAGGNAPGFAQSAAYGGSTGTQTQTQDNSSIQNFSAQQQARAPSTSDATQTPGQDHHSAYPFTLDNAYAAQQALAQSAPGAQYQTVGHAAASVDVQALLDSLNPSALNAPSGQYAAPQMSSPSAQAQANASTASLSSAASLPPRPPAQDQPATHPNYSPTDDIRSFHPHSQQPSSAQQRAGNGQLQTMNVRAQNYGSLAQGGAQSPRTPANALQNQGVIRSETPDDEDIRWPPEINKKYEDFLDQERKFVTEGQWDQFPLGSRLFIGKADTRLCTTQSNSARQSPYRKSYEARHLPPVLPTRQARTNIY
tara:strand:- start:2248 stop:3459 length:1212 start_codon:yes stop_codon:yes gene_type:complete